MKANKKRGRLSDWPLLWPLLALGAVLAFNFLFSSGFYHIEWKDGHLYGSLIDVLKRASPVMLIALGMTWVIATGGIDLSVGATTALSGAAVALALRNGWGTGSAIGVSLLVALAAGAWNGLLVAWIEVQPIVATLILMVAGRGLAQLMTGGQIIAIPLGDFKVLGSGFLFALPFSISLVAGVSAVAGFLGRKTAMGLYIESVGNNPVATRYAGVSSGWVKFLVYVACGGFAGLAGLIIASDVSAADVNNSGLYLELDAILAVVIGGTALQGGRFSLVGSLVGALLIQTVTTTIHTRGLAVELTLIIKALVVLGVCLLHSDALRTFLRGSFKSQIGRARYALSRKPT